MDLADLQGPGAVTARAARDLDARWKLASAGIATGITVALRSPLAAALALLGSILLISWARLPFRWLCGRLGMLLPFLLLLCLPLPLLVRDDGPAWEWAGMRFSWHGLIVAVVILCKAATMFLLVLFVLATTPLPLAFKAAHTLYVPGTLVHLAQLSHRYVFVLADELARMRTALRVRGFRNRPDRHSYRTIGHVAGTLLVRGHERAERVAQAMRCRGFAGRFQALASFRTTARDAFFFLTTVAFFAAMLALDWWLR